MRDERKLNELTDKLARHQRGEHWRSSVECPVCGASEDKWDCLPGTSPDQCRDCYTEARHRAHEIVNGAAA